MVAYYLPTAAVRQYWLPAFVAALLLLLGSPLPSAAQGLQNLGMVGIQSVHGRFLQAHTSGELHASNSKRNEEETWFLVQVDRAKHIYALQNWRNGKYLSKSGGNCAPAAATTLSVREQWELVPGQRFGIANAVAIRSVADGTYLGANPPGRDTNCGGEAAAGSAAAPPSNQGMWPGWWVLTPATEPSPGKDAWNTIGGVFAGIAAKINPADVVALLAAIL
jgi:hypothetical protein